MRGVYWDETKRKSLNTTAGGQTWRLCEIENTHAVTEHGDGILAEKKSLRSKYGSLKWDVSSGL